MAVATAEPIAIAAMMRALRRGARPIDSLMKRKIIWTLESRLERRLQARLPAPHLVRARFASITSVAPSRGDFNGIGLHPPPMPIVEITIADPQFRQITSGPFLIIALRAADRAGVERCRESVVRASRSR